MLLLENLVGFTLRPGHRQQDDAVAVAGEVKPFLAQQAARVREVHIEVSETTGREEVPACYKRPVRGLAAQHRRRREVGRELLGGGHHQFIQIEVAAFPDLVGVSVLPEDDE